jgi:hypothetical protein
MSEPLQQVVGNRAVNQALKNQIPQPGATTGGMPSTTQPPTSGGDGGLVEDLEEGVEVLGELAADIL